MGGRAIPTYCEHGVMVNGGGHLDDADECRACNDETGQSDDDRHLIAQALVEIAFVEFAADEWLDELDPEEIARIQMIAAEMVPFVDPDGPEVSAAFDRLAGRAGR